MKESHLRLKKLSKIRNYTFLWVFSHDIIGNSGEHNSYDEMIEYE